MCEHYKEISRIGKGSFGTVYLCEDDRTAEKVVIKKIGEVSKGISTIFGSIPIDVVYVWRMVSNFVLLGCSHRRDVDFGEGGCAAGGPRPELAHAPEYRSIH